jgi:hypothetical protein
LLTLKTNRQMAGQLGYLLFMCCVQAQALLQAAREKMRAEAVMVSAIAAGTQDFSWIDATLKRLGCEFED